MCSSSTPTANTAKAKPKTTCAPEDIDKIVHAYRAGQDVPAYARRVPVAEIKAEDYNCNIRRYVDNAPPPEPHDVRAHLHGGVPVAEVDALAHYWTQLPRPARKLLHRCARLSNKARIATPTSPPPCQASAPSLTTSPSTPACNSARRTIHAATERTWWQAHLPVIEALAPDALLTTTSTPQATQRVRRARRAAGRH